MTLRLTRGKTRARSGNTGRKEIMDSEILERFEAIEKRMNEIEARLSGVATTAEAVPPATEWPGIDVWPAAVPLAWNDAGFITPAKGGDIDLARDVEMILVDGRHGYGYWDGDAWAMYKDALDARDIWNMLEDVDCLAWREVQTEA